MSQRWCRFKKNNVIEYGWIHEDEIVVVHGMPWGNPTETGAKYPLSSVKLLAPVVPPTFYCVGLNYPAHIIAIAKRTGVEPNFPPRPDVAYRANNALCGQNDPIIKPNDAGEDFQYEGELVVVIGKEGKFIQPENALDYVFGWTIGNDVSERNWQRSDRTNWRAKNCDTFNPMGPWITTDLDYRKMTTIVRLNNEEVERFATGDMHHDVETYIVEISKYCTLYPGDIIWMGTDGAPRNMKPGDLCEVEITGIGTLRNTVIAQTSNGA